MVPSHRIPTHPGEILAEEFLAPLGISRSEFARKLEVPVQRIHELIRGKRGITAETAWLLSAALDTTPEFWANLQTSYDLARAAPARRIAKKKAPGRRTSA